MSDELLESLLKSVASVQSWVDAGYPDLDDPKERQHFMFDVRRMAITFHEYATATDYWRTHK